MLSISFIAGSLERRGLLSSAPTKDLHAPGVHRAQGVRKLRSRARTLVPRLRGILIPCAARYRMFRGHVSARRYCISLEFFRLREYRPECTHAYIYIYIRVYPLTTHLFTRSRTDDGKTLFASGPRARPENTAAEMSAVCSSHAECMNPEFVGTAGCNNSEKKIAPLSVEGKGEGENNFRLPSLEPSRQTNHSYQRNVENDVEFKTKGVSATFGAWMRVLSCSRGCLSPVISGTSSGRRLCDYGCGKEAEKEAAAIKGRLRERKSSVAASRFVAMKTRRRTRCASATARVPCRDAIVRRKAPLWPFNPFFFVFFYFFFYSFIVILFLHSLRLFYHLLLLHLPYLHFLSLFFISLLPIFLLLSIINKTVGSISQQHFHLFLCFLSFCFFPKRIRRSWTSRSATSTLRKNREKNTLLYRATEENTVGFAAGYVGENPRRIIRITFSFVESERRVEYSPRDSKRAELPLARISERTNRRTVHFVLPTSLWRSNRSKETTSFPRETRERGRLATQRPSCSGDLVAR